MKKLISLILITILTVLSISTGALAEPEQMDSGYLIFRDKSHGVKWIYDKSKTLSLVYIPKDEVANYPTKEFTDKELEKYYMYGYEYLIDYAVSEDFFDFTNYKIDTIVYGKGVSTSDFGASYLGLDSVKFNGQSGALCRLGYNEFYHIDTTGFSEIGARALESNWVLEKIDLSKIKVLGEGSMKATGVKKINLKSAEKINHASFNGCKKLSKITFGKRLKYIGDKAFSGTAIKKITLPNSVTTIGSQVFEGCKKLKYVKIGDKVKKLPAVFYNCPNLEKIVLGKNLKEINNSSGGSWWVDDIDYAFEGCKKLSSIVLNNTKKAPKIKGGVFETTKPGIKFYVKNKKVAKDLKNKLKNTGVRKAKIYVGKKLVYKNITMPFKNN